MLATGLSGGLLATFASVNVARAELPRMANDGSASTVCKEDGDGQLWRLQCDPKTKRCLYAPDAELDENGKRIRGLDRIEPCTSSGPLDLEKLEREGFRTEPAVPPAPQGWMRDERGRVFQYSFDLHRRLYVGGGVAPVLDGKKVKTHGYVDFSLLQLETYRSTESPLRSRLRLVEGEVRLAPFAAEGVLLRWDLSERRRDPLLRVTTFVPRPHRNDLHLNMGVLVELGRIEIIPRDVGGNANVTRWMTLNPTFDLWQSRDLYSYVRLRGGASLERTTFDDLPDRSAVSPNGALEADFTLDRDGFHHITVFGGAELPRYYDADRGFRGTGGKRLRGELGYEVILLALNDQPVTLRLSAIATRRDDIPGLTTGTVIHGNAGLRFNLWAPAREP